MVEPEADLRDVDETEEDDSGLVAADCDTTTRKPWINS